MKLHCHFILLTIFCAPVFTVLSSCEKKNMSKPVSVSQTQPVKVMTYDHKGLKIVHPNDWVIDYDGPGIYADRAVAFESEGLSRITVYFYKKYPRTIFEHADYFERELNLGRTENVRNYKRSEVEVGGYRGFDLTWTSTLLGETRIKLTMLQVRSKPYPVFVDFNFFDDDIKIQNTKIIPFVEKILFDPEKIEL